MNSTITSNDRVISYGHVMSKAVSFSPEIIARVAKIQKSLVIQLGRH